MTLLASLGVPGGSVQVAAGGPSYLHPGRALTLRMGPKTVVGFCGELHPDILRAMDVSGPIACFEIILDALPAPEGQAHESTAEARAVRPDAGGARLRLPGGSERSGRRSGHGRALGRSHARVPGGPSSTFTKDRAFRQARNRSAFAVTLQPTGKTLTDAEIERVSASIVEGVAKRTGAVLRA